MLCFASFFVKKNLGELFSQVNLDTYDDVAKDYRFYEDPGDEFRNPPDGVSKKKLTNVGFFSRQS